MPCWFVACIALSSLGPRLGLPRVALIIKLPIVFETEFQDVATPENAANRDLKSAYADNNEIKAYQAEWDLNIL